MEEKTILTNFSEKDNLDQGYMIYDATEALGLEGVRFLRMDKYSSMEGTDTVKVKNVPGFLKEKFGKALETGDLSKTLDHYRVELDRLGIMDPAYLAKLEEFAEEARLTLKLESNKDQLYEANKGLLSEINVMLDDLYPAPNR